MAFLTSRFTKTEIFNAPFFSSWVTLGPAAINVLVFVGLTALAFKRWQAFDAYLLTLVAALLVGTVFSWIKIWREHQEIRQSVARLPGPPEQERVLRSAAALLHLSSFYWAMGAFIAALAIDRATR